MRTFATFVDGDNVLATGGTVHRYRGDIPRINPVALLSAAQGIRQLNAMARRVPVDAPWDAPRAAAWDARSVRAWLTPSRVPTRLARDLLEATVRACFACDPAEVSLLCWLFLVRSAGGVEPLMNVAGGYQDSQFEGGVGRVTDAVAAELGDAVVLSSPVTARDPERGPRRGRVRTRHRVVTLRRAGAPQGAGRRHPLRPHAPGGPRAAPAPDARGYRGEDGGDLRRALLARRRHHRRDRGHRRHHRDHPRHHPARPRPRGHRHLRRRARGPGRCGPWTNASAGPMLLTMLARRLGPRAATPLEVLEVNWAEERWTRGCSMAHFPTGVLTQYGRRLREPVGRLHWAGTETATVSWGAMDGAVRSGERVAAEILSAGTAGIESGD